MFLLIRLKKLSPKENLNIPPLKYEFVYKLKEYFKNDEIIVLLSLYSSTSIGAPAFN